ncbi:MAG: phosphogluconate dehydratase, partial [Hyphomicrobiaceae bacterium]|nr:phosphogluconate dehydratase [Hyphomicrobiaceae bacterium]
MSVRKEIEAVTNRIRERSRASRETYLEQVEEMASRGPHRSALSCSNLAHGFAACGAAEKADLSADVKPNLGIITA